MFYAFPYINYKKVMLISELGRNTKYFLSLDTVYLKISTCFVAFFPSLFHFILKQ